ncbi:MAG TPA: hypothetical protein VIV60_27415, partial [Polyangiaceae bacterium]
MQRQSISGLKLYVVLFLPSLLSCGPELQQDDAGESVESSSASLSGPRSECGTRFVAPDGNDSPTQAGA